MQQTKMKNNRTSSRSFFQRRFFQKISSLKSHFTVQMFSNLLGMPVILLITQLLRCRNFVHSQSSRNFSEAVTSCLFIITAAITAAAVIWTAVTSFRYLGNKNENDINISLPVNSRQRFTADYLAGITICLVPQIISAVLSFIVLAAGQLIFPHPEELKIFFMYSMRFEISSVPAALITVLTGLILINIMLFTLTVLMTVLCGNSACAAVFTVIANAAVPVFLYTAVSLRYAEAYESYSFCHAVDIVSVTSPAGGIAELLGILMPYEIPFISFGIWFAGTVFMTAIYFSAAFILYMKRKSEDVSKTFIFSPAYGLISAAVIFSAAGIPASMGLGIMPVIVTVTVTFAVSELIKNSFAFKASDIIKDIPYAAAAFLAFVIVQKTAVPEGYTAQIPEPDQISYALIDTSWNDLGFLRELKITEPDSIKNLTSIHQQIKQQNLRPNDNSLNFRPVDISYKLKNGKFVTFHNYYDYDDDKSKTAVQSVITSSENAFSEICDEFENCLKDYYYIDEYKCTIIVVGSATVSVKNPDDNASILYLNDNNTDCLKGITDALRKDLHSLKDGFIEEKQDTTLLNHHKYMLPPYEFPETTEALNKAKDIMTLSSLSKNK